MIPCNLKCFIFLLLSCSVSTLDLTLVPKSKGTPVVQACIAKISKADLFSCDQQLLQRIAFTRFNVEFLNFISKVLIYMYIHYTCTCRLALQPCLLDPFGISMKTYPPLT